ncbi:hypothetical protein FACI_IFERC00001G0442 [Ferroplasma acidarmanus Fer1]|uniref:Uncharacterized protein n=1 Tax=Ferroplasma acidarmanus Fer1 TaxID=333146 RepID=S0ANT9_FERAC|nr:hypothetical protein FACI_IFERC00001G0442 [Ferroplasma acidarmanus Fer1]
MLNFELPGSINNKTAKIEMDAIKHPAKFVRGTPKYMPGTAQCHRCMEKRGSKDKSIATINIDEVTIFPRPASHEKYNSEDQRNGIATGTLNSSGPRIEEYTYLPNGMPVCTPKNSIKKARM